jgi:hypothetical protein
MRLITHSMRLALHCITHSRCIYQRQTEEEEKQYHINYSFCTSYIILHYSFYMYLPTPDRGGKVSY